MSHTRRTFLKSTLAAGGWLMIGCDADAADPVDTLGGVAPDTVGGVPEDTAYGRDGTHQQPPRVACDPPVVGGEFVAAMPFLFEGDGPMDTKVGGGIGGRLYSDLGTIDESNPTTPLDKFFIRTFLPPGINTQDPWRIRVGGLVDTATTLTMADLRPRVQPMGHYALECSGNGAFARFGLLSAIDFDGVPMSDVLDLIDIGSDATRVLFSGFDYKRGLGNNVPGASWVMSFEQLTDAGAFLATHMGGEPLLPDHGFPVRLFMPGWYGCSCIKWLNELRFVDEDEPATAQMQEFASRTHQVGVPDLARDYAPAEMHQAAMPVRVEKWRVDGQVTYRVVGVMWGGRQVIDDTLEIRFGQPGGVFQPVDICPAMRGNANWTFWEHRWDPPSAGQFQIRCRIDDPEVPQRRLDSGFYDRFVMIDEV